MCFAVPEKEVEAVSAALHSRFRQALDAGRLSQVLYFDFIGFMVTAACGPACCTCILLIYQLRIRSDNTLFH